MHARVTYTMIQPGADKVHEAIRVLRESVLPDFKSVEGFRGAFLLVDRAVGKGMTIVLYESHAQLAETRQSGHHHRQVGKVRHLLAAEPFHEEYEVAFQDGEIDRGIAHARVTFTHMNAQSGERVNEAIGIYKETVLQEARRWPGYEGALLLIDHMSGKHISFNMYDSEEHMRAVERDGRSHRSIAKFAHLFSGPPTRETFEVAEIQASGAAA
jgi:hypothetical protein